MKQYDLTKALFELKKATGGFVSIKAEVNLHTDADKASMKFTAYTSEGGWSNEKDKLQDAVEEAIKLYKEKIEEQEINSDRFIVNN